MTRFVPLALAAALLPAAVPVDPSPAAARAVVQRYYNALDHRDYRTAYALWGDGGRRSGQDYAQFVRGFLRTAHTAVVAGAATDGEGAAGSSFVTVPVDVRATLSDGTRQHFTGTYVLRRVNDVDGSTAEQRRWHLESATLRLAR